MKLKKKPVGSIPINRKFIRGGGGRQWVYQVVYKFDPRTESLTRTYTYEFCVRRNSFSEWPGLTEVYMLPK